MDNAISIKSGQLKINPAHLLIVLAIVFIAFILANVLTVKHVAKYTPELAYDDIAGLAEEIYDAGTITEAVKTLPLDAAIIDKMCGEITGKLTKTTDYPNCEVYFLEVAQPGVYPILGYGDVVIGYTNLNVGNVWKVGMTGNGENGRYSGNYFYKSNNGSFRLTNKQLVYRTKSRGTYKQMIVLEKLLIYTYSLWSGYPDLLKPPGCKIFR